MDFGSLPWAVVEQIDQACDEFESAWREDRRPRIEDYLERTDSEGRSTLLRAILATELELRRIEGETPSLLEYLSRFPTEVGVIRGRVPSQPTPSAVSLTPDRSRGRTHRAG